jgi:hypothetical protein
MRRISISNAMHVTGNSPKGICRSSRNTGEQLTRNMAKELSTISMYPSKEE